MLEQIAVSVVRAIIDENLKNGNDLITHNRLKEHFSESYEERVTGSRSSNKTYMQKAINDLVEKEGDLIGVNEGERYICPLDHDELLESIENELNKHVGLTDIDLENIFTRVENIYSVNLAIADPQTYDDNDDDLDLDDDDDLDFEGIIKFRKEMYDEPNTSDSKKNEDDADADEDDDDMDELDKLLKEVSNEIKIQYIVKSSEDAKVYVARRCETKDEAKQLCYDMRDGINGETIVHFLDAYIYFDHISDDEYNEFRRDNA